MSATKYLYNSDDIVAPPGWRIIDYRVPLHKENFIATCEGKNIFKCDFGYTKTARYIVEPTT